MRGVWYTTSGGAGVLMAAAVAAGIYGAAWVLAHLVLILATGAGCAVLTALAVRWLISWSDQRAIRVWAQRPAQLSASQAPAVPRPGRPAITGGVTLNFINLTPAEQAEVIRQALPVQPGDAITERK